MEPAVLAGVLMLSLAIAVAAAWASLSLTMSLITRAALWTGSPEVVPPAWADEPALQEHAAPARQPLAA